MVHESLGHRGVFQNNVLATIQECDEKVHGACWAWSGQIGAASRAWEDRIGVNPGSTRWIQSELDLALGMDHDSTPSQVLSPCEAGQGPLLFFMLAF